MGRWLPIVPVGLAQILSMGSRYVFLVLVARFTSLEQFGTFSVVSATVTWLSVVVVGGWTTSTLAHVPKHGLTISDLRHVETRMAAVSVLLGVFQALLLTILLPESIDFLAMAVAGAWLAFLSISQVLNDLIRSTGHVLQARLLDAVVPPGVASLMLVIWSHFVPVDVLVVLTVTACSLVIAVAVYRMRVRNYVVPRSSLGIKGAPAKRSDFFWIKLSQAALGAAGIVVVSAMLGTEEGARYSVASKVAILAGLGLNSVVMLYGPKLSAAAGSAPKLRALTKEATVLSMVATTPVVLVILLMAPHILAIFGSDYTEATGLLVCLMVGSAANAILGPVGTVVNVNGQERMSRNVMLVFAILYLALLPVAILLYGAFGAALLWTGTTIGWNLILWLKLDYDAEGSLAIRKKGHISSSSTR